MDPLSDYFADCGDSSEVIDDPMLIDMHLGNALNLDLIEFLVLGKEPEYPLYVPRFYKTAWAKLQELIPSHYESRIGFLEISTKVFLTQNLGQEKLTPKLWKQLGDIVIKGLSKKGIEIPITNPEVRIDRINVFVPKIWIVMFNIILSTLSTLSEILRGGKNLPYATVWSKGEHAISNLVPNSNIIIIVGRNVTAIVDHDNRISYIGNYDSALLLMDTIGQRLCALAGIQIASQYNIKGCVPVDNMMDIIKIGDSILNLNGNSGFEIIAMFEALVVSIILQKSPDYLGLSGEFYQNCMEETIEICNGSAHPRETLQEIERLIHCLSRETPDCLSNIFCMYRIWGHPAVNIKAGMEKVYSKAMAQKTTLNLSENLTLCQFRHMFLQNYLSKHKGYPPMTVLGSGYVHKCLNAGHAVNVKSPEYVLLDYLTVEIGQIWTVPETYDVCHILNDKAVSPTRSELYQSVSNGKGTVFGTLRRGIIRWMEGDSIRCKEFLEDIDENGLSDDDLIIGMYEKEREIKVKARMFSLMSEKMRMYIVLTEELIANHILPYFPEITMKDPLNVQMRKIWKVGGAGQSKLNPNINVDFEKWNLNMRSEFTDGLFRQMDKMFGFSNLILRTHNIFEASYVYSCSGKYNPPCNHLGFLQDPPMAYTGHMGGFEGLRQKGWTVATVCLLAYTAWQIKLDMQLLGQGDNQVIKLYMPTRRWENLCYTEENRIRESKELTERYITKMRENFEDAGLPIKVRETWISTRLFMYGKSMYLDGHSLPQWLKKLLRSYALSNEGTITISGVIGTIATNMTSAAGVSEAPDVMYLIYLFLGEWSLEYLLHYHPFTRRKIKQGSRENFRIPGVRKNLTTPPISLHRLIASLLLIPTAVGGSVTIPLTGFITRGFPDHASEGYAWINMLRSVESPFQGLFRNWYSFLKNKSVQCDMLVQSPWSINHMKPPTPGLQSRDMIRDWLLSGRFHKNRFLKSMSHINKTFDRKKICRELMSDPMNPLVTYEIFNSFPQSYFDSVLRRFEGTRSVRKLAMRESYTQPVVRKLIEIEDNHIFYMCWRGEVSGDIFSECATTQAREARNVGWERHIKGLTTPHPLEYAYETVCQGYNPNCDGSDYILTRVDPDGEYPPYLGSKVRTKVVSLQDEGARSEPLICSNARLARYLKWLNLGENMINIVRLSSESLCDTNIFDNFYDVTPGMEGYTGCTEHRFNPDAASDGCFINYAPQLGSKVYMSGDYMPQFGKGKENYTIHFQALYCFLQYTSARSSKMTSSHHHLTCTGCIVPCDDLISDISADHPNIDTAFKEENQAILRETIGFISERPRVVLKAREYLELSNEVPFRPEELSVTGCYYGMIYLLATKCSLSILTRGSDSDMMGTEDLQSFPRVYSYKIYVENIIESLCNVLLYMFMMRNKEGMNTSGMLKAKKALIRFLDNSPLNKFKDISSLCVGRNTRSEKVRYRIPTGGFPDDPISFIRGVKTCIIDTLMENTGFTYNIPKRMYMAKLGITEKEYKTVLGMIGVMKYSCSSCGELTWKDVPLLEETCRLGHLRLLLDQVRLTPASIDRISKLLTVKNSLWEDDRIHLPILDAMILSRSDLTSFEEKQSLTAKSFKRINLPTASIYKWTSVMSILDPFMWDVVIILGDGTGGTSYLASQHFRSAKIYPLAKFERHKMIPQDSESIHPFLSRGFSNVKYDLLDSLPDDIQNPRWSYEFNVTVRKISGRVLLISDIEGIDGNQSICSILKSVSDIDVTMILKAYYREIGGNFHESLPYLISTYHANTEYTEVFLTNLVPEEVLPNYEGNSSNTNERCRMEQRVVEEAFKSPMSLSWSLSRHRLTSLGISMGKRILLGDPSILLSSLMGHINSRYRFPQDKIKIYDVRNLSDGILKRLIRAVKLIILSFSTESILESDWYNNLSLARAGSRDRVPGKITRRINIVIGTEDQSKIEHEDILAARTIRGSRGYIIEIRGIDQIVEMVDRNPKIDYDLNLYDMIYELNSVEDPSDLEYY